MVINYTHLLYKQRKLGKAMTSDMKTTVGLWKPFFININEQLIDSAKI